MKIIEHKTNSYGIVRYAEVAGIDQTKIQDMYFKIHPVVGAYSTKAGDDSRSQKLNQNPNVPDKEKKEFAFLLNIVFFIPLDEINKDWHIVNKDLALSDDYLGRMIKSKNCPVTMPEDLFMKWFIDVYPYLNDEWKIENSDYMRKMDEKIFAINNRMLDGFKNQDMKEIRASMKYGADINFENNGKTPLRYTIEYQNQELLGYLINKKVKLPENFEVSEDNILSEKLKEYQRKQTKKSNKMKM